MKKRRDGHANFLKSHYDEAIRNFSEGILLLPNVDMYAKDMMQFYWKRAECYLKKVSITDFDYYSEKLFHLTLVVLLCFSNQHDVLY